MSHGAAQDFSGVARDDPIVKLDEKLNSEIEIAPLQSVCGNSFPVSGKSNL